MESFRFFSISYNRCIGLYGGCFIWDYLGLYGGYFVFLSILSGYMGVIYGEIR